MASDVPLDYAVFQLSPRRSRCELFVSYDGIMEKLASGLAKPFVTNLKVAEEQVASAVKSFKLEVERYKGEETWFTKGTLERFVRFVSTPEVLEMVNTYDAEMSQLESARRIYSQGEVDDQSTASGGGGIGASDATKKELLRAIDVRLEAVKQDLTTACNCASGAGFDPETVLELLHFADHFGAHRLSQACSKFIGLSQRRPELFLTATAAATATASTDTPWNFSSYNALRSSTGSDMSLDDLPNSSTCHQPTTTKDKDKDKSLGMGPTTTTPTAKSDSSTLTQSTGTPQLTRRLSVQERISLFESKQKDNSPSVSTPSSASAGVKPEVRRLSSEVNSSSDKAVLRRWSGASDMSIDVSGERKESDSNVNNPTPSSSSNFPVFAQKSKDHQGGLKPEEGAKDKDSTFPVKEKFGAKVAVFSAAGGGSELEVSASSDSGSKIPPFPGRSLENVGLKDQQPIVGRVRSRAASFGRCEDFGLENQSSPSQIQFKSLSGKKEQCGSADLTGCEEKLKGSSGGGSTPQEDNFKNFGLLAAGFGSRLEGQYSEAENEGLRSHFREPWRGTVEVSSESGAAEENSQSLIQNKEVEADTMPPQPKWGSLGAEVEKSGRKDSESFEKLPERSLMQMENSGQLKPKFQGHVPVSELKNMGGRKEENDFGSESTQTGFKEKILWEDQEPLSSASLGPVDQAQRARQSKGNQGLNDELKMKANELEKLFAEHKLRAPGDQLNFARRTRPAERPKEQDGSAVSWKPAVQASPGQSTVMKTESENANSSNMEKFNSTPLMKTVDNKDYDVTPKHNIYSLGFSDESRGKLYQKYMQKRDARLREDWSSRRAEKEAKLKAMQDALEKSRAEMKAKLLESADKKSSAHSARSRAEKLRSFNVRSAMKREQLVDSLMSDEDEHQAEFLGKKLSETFLSDSSSKSAQSKRVLPNKNTASSTPRNSSIPVPWSSGKASNSAAGRRRLNSDNPLAQSVPNFSDLRKENTKPSSAASKPARSQGRNHTRKKSSSDDLPLPNEEKPRRIQSLRKSTVSPMELNDSRNSNDVNDIGFMSPKYDIEENDHYDKFPNDIKSMPFSRKINGAGHISGFAIGRSKASVMVDDRKFEAEEMIDVAKEDEDDFERHDMDNGNGRLSQESDKSANSGYENNDFRFSQAGLTSITELPTSMPSIFRTMGSIQDSPGESPGSWNSRVQNPFSFPNEISDIDASDSPIGSPASWNFHTLGQGDTEATRMRKKWGAAQKPIVGADSSHSLSRKDVTKGLKRFLKFGRKNRPSESLADWISATTSEGDDDTEDVRDPAYRSSEDLRKSRMGFAHNHHSDDGFNESDILNEQAAPKSFFSLSNFRSKGSDSKPR